MFVRFFSRCPSFLLSRAARGLVSPPAAAASPPQPQPTAAAITCCSSSGAAAAAAGRPAPAALGHPLDDFPRDGRERVLDAVASLGGRLEKRNAELARERGALICGDGALGVGDVGFVPDEGLFFLVVFI